ncbi:hypothetical protein [Marinobacterium stanieri]|uniref:hypothetical protein n=1 Tax=Marinobacterium stanieri TaxID=49186 RepID=UPI0002557827|nr:hypothetical protein [Marinobacterium stanieri]
MDMTHDALSGLASKWLKRSYSANGPGCHVGLVEVGGLFGGERADAWGYRWGHRGGSVLVEVKTSRSDFLADAKKPHRNGEKLGMGLYRYYLCPEGIIQPDELPDGWGLLWVNKRGHIKPKAGHVLLLKSWKTMSELEPWQHEVNVKGEMELMAHLLARLGDPQELNKKYRLMQSEVSRLTQRVNKLLEEQREIPFLKAELSSYKMREGAA